VKFIDVARRLELQRRTEQMILTGKHSERDSANRQENCVSAKPEPVPRKSDETNRGNEQNNDARHEKPPKDMKRLQPWVDGIAEDHDVFQSLAKHNHGHQNQDQFPEANYSRNKVESPIAFRSEERPLISLPNYNSDRPE
jgi:hypothetical protein